MSALSFFYVCFPRISALFVMPEFSAARFKKNKKGAEFFAPRPQIFGKIVPQSALFYDIHAFGLFDFARKRAVGVFAPFDF